MLRFTDTSSPQSLSHEVLSGPYGPSLVEALRSCPALQVMGSQIDEDQGPQVLSIKHIIQLVGL